MSRGDRYHEVRARLADRFPSCIAPKDRPKKPLKVGIRDDIKAACPDLPITDISLFLRSYTSSRNYLVSCLPNAPRVGLDGECAGVVEPRQAVYAFRLLAKKEEKSIAELAAAFT